MEGIEREGSVTQQVDSSVSGSVGNVEYKVEMLGRPQKRLAMEALVRTTEAVLHEK